MTKSLKKKTFWLDSRIAKMSEEGDELKISGYASTGATDRVGDIILPEAWTAKGGLENFKKNPIILFNHNYNSPIGRATEIEVDEKGLKLTATISKSAPQYDLIKDGVLSTFSVGFLVRDADYNKTTDGFIIKEAELLETSVVTVPCNQDATFSVSKSFENREELKEFMKNLDIDSPELQSQESEDNANVLESDDTDQTGTIEASEKRLMNPEELEQKIAEATAKAIAAAEEKRLAAEKAAKEKAEAEAALTATVETAVKDSTLAITEAFEKKLKENNENFEKTFNEMKSALEEKSAEFAAMRESKRLFGAPNGKPDMKTFEKDIDDAFLLSRITAVRGAKKFDETKFGKEIFEKVNTHSAVTVSSEEFERMAAANIERDIQNELVLAPLFREISMNAANMTVPIMPDAGYAEITGNTTASGTAPNGNLDARGAAYGSPYGGVSLPEINLNTVKMIARSYLGNETEEDAVIPILPLIRDSMIRSHARGVENLLLAGNDADGVYTSGAKDGLIKLARSNGRMVTAAGTSTALTANALFGLRRVMGKYGVNPRDVVYIVSQTGYYDLINDAEFQDADLVGNVATKLTGEIGMVYGSKVLMCDEFAAPGAGKFHALAVNTRNFVVPRLRGVTVESDYEVADQRRVLVTSQRLGFNEIIANATSVVGLRYATA